MSLGRAQKGSTLTKGQGYVSLPGGRLCDPDCYSATEAGKLAVHTGMVWGMGAGPVEVRQSEGR